MKIIHQLPTISEYMELRKLAGWWEIDKNAAETALRNSLFSVIAVDNNNVVGLGRVIGDGGLYFYIQDLIVHPKFQRKSLGKTLMSELMNHIRANARPGAFVGLMAAKGLEKYYELFGFRARDVNAPGMYQVMR